MAFSAWKVIKSLLISEEGTLTPKQIEIVPGGSASTKTTIQSSQTGNVTLTLPNVTDTVVTKTTTDVLTNKSLSDSTTLIVDASDNTKQIAFDAAGTSGTKTTLTGSQTVNRILTLPDATDTLMGKATVDVLTNKTFDANGTGNSISNIENADIAAGAAIAYSKLATAPTGSVLLGNAGTPTMTALTGDVTVGATGVTAIGNNKVVLGQLATLAANSVIGNSTGSTATPTAVPMTQTATASAVAMRDSNANLLANNLIEGYATTVTAAGTTTLTVASAWQQFFTGSTTQTVTLPVTSTLALGQSFYIVNNSTGIVTVNSSGGNVVKAIPAGGSLWVTCILTSGTTAASWSADYADGISTIDTISNKTFGNSNTYTARTDRFTLQDSADTTKQGVFSLSPVSTGTTRTYTLPDQTGTVALLNQAQTFSAQQTFSSAINLTSGQIAFPAAQAASANVNTLDDYEEGTFTPTTQGGSSAGTGTYVVQNGWYTKIGQMVYFSLRVQTSAHTGTGDIRIAGLPFTSTNNVSGNAGFCSILPDSYTFTAGHYVPVGYVIPNDTKLTFYSVATGGGVSTNVAIDAVCTVMIAGHYKVD